MSSLLRDKIFERDNYTCVYCGELFNRDELHVDHILPKAKGGGGDEGNLTTACVRCNLLKSDLLLEDFLMKIIVRRNECRMDLEYYSKIIPKLKKRVW